MDPQAEHQQLNDAPQRAQQLAQATAAHMYANDAATRALGIQLIDAQPGRARMQMTVRADMLNGHRTCHGGFIFSLADSAFAFACNSYNQNTVASAAHIDFLAPAREGETLEAEAIERSAAGRTGVYDVTVRTGDGRTVALFRGKSARISGQVIEGLKEA